MSSQPVIVRDRPTVAHALRRAAVRATLAPSVHNTQPWRFVLGPQVLEIHADRSRQLGALDPSGRQLLISCGCALFNARVSLAAAGYRAIVERLPDPLQPTLLARIRVDTGDAPLGTNDGNDIGGLDAVIELRRSNRRRFADDRVPAEVVSIAVEAARAEGSVLFEITRPEDRVATATWSQRADADQNADAAYRAELRVWTTDDPGRDDGVAARSVPQGGAGAHDEIPVRDFDTTGSGELPTETRSSSQQCLLLLSSVQDDTVSWLQAGEALERVLLEISRHGFVASPLTQVVEVPFTRQMLRDDLRLTTYPLVLLRVGRAPYTPASRRRRLVSMLTESH